jgi:hypothetical protein
MACVLSQNDDCDSLTGLSNQTAILMLTHPVQNDGESSSADCIKIGLALDLFRQRPIAYPTHSDRIALNLLLRPCSAVTLASDRTPRERVVEAASRCPICCHAKFRRPPMPRKERQYRPKTRANLDGTTFASDLRSACFRRPQGRTPPGQPCGLSQKNVSEQGGKVLVAVRNRKRSTALLKG